MKKSVFLSNLSEQRSAVSKLIDESHADSDYYLYLVIAGLIATMGLHLDNTVVIIGAMLIAPVLFPIMSLGMGFVTSSREALRRALVILGKSIAFVVGGSAILSFLLNEGVITETMVMASSPSFISFLIAVLSGVIASYSWVKQSQSAMLPGVAVTVSLVPPLANIGIGISLLSREIFSGSVLMFFINLLGITIASIAVFLLFGFASMQGYQDKRIEKEKKAGSQKQAEKQKTVEQKISE